jgi:branched-chain amino acid transport system substrate-binding protein
VTRAGWCVALCCLALVAASGCGTRLSRQEVLSQNSSRDARAAPPVAASAPTGDADAPGSGDTSAPGDQTASGDASATGVQAAGGSPASAQAGGSASSATAAAAQPAGSGATAATKAPIVIGFVGWLGGVGAASIAPSRDAWVAWQKLMNAKGGINGHRVDLLIGDDGGNQSRAVSIARDFVENKGAIALTWASVDVTGVANYAKAKSIPVIGSLSSEPPWSQNPMLFAPAPGVDETSWGTARVVKNAGAKKVGVLFCAESAVCQQTGAADIKAAKEEGLNVVYSGQISFSQPDYTAECLQLRNAGAEAVFAVTEETSAVRLAQSCGRQSYHPIWTAVASDTMLRVPEFEGALSALTAFPWFARSGSPAIDEYVGAFQKYAPNRLRDGTLFQSMGWLSAKLFEKAAANVSDRPTSQDVLNGLWAMKGETVGGLAPGGLARTFPRNQPTPKAFCVFNAKVDHGKWVAPQGFTPVCR